MNNKTLWAVLGVVAVIVIAWLFMRTPSDTVSMTNNGADNTNQPAGTEGRVIFSVTDAAANMDNVSEIRMSVSKAEMHSPTEGWVTLSTTAKSYNLLELNAKNESMLLSNSNVRVDSYDQVRLSVDSVAVVLKNGETKVAKVPSGQMNINTQVVVKANETSSVNFDFLADKSLHTTGNGSYIFAPVVKTESRSSADVSIDADSSVNIGGGKVDHSNTMGMDIDGSVKLDFEIKKDAKLNLDSNSMIKLDL